MVRVLITEAHDGLGLALVKEYLTDADNQVVAFCGDATQRDDLDTLKATYQTQLLIVDVNLADEESIKASVVPIEAFVDALDLLIYNSGFLHEDFYKVDRDIPQDVINAYKHIIWHSHKWLFNSVKTLLYNGVETKFFGIPPYLSQPIESTHSLFAYSLFTWRHFSLTSIIKDVDPTVVSVYQADCLVTELWFVAKLSETEADRIGEIFRIDDLVGEQAIAEKSKAIRLNVPKIPHGYHMIQTVWHT